MTSGNTWWAMSKCSGVVARIRPAMAPVGHPHRRRPMAITPPTAATAARIPGRAALSSVTRPKGSDTSAMSQK